MCFSNGGLHGCYIDGEDIGGAELGVGETNGIVDIKKMT